MDIHLLYTASQNRNIAILTRRVYLKFLKMKIGKNIQLIAVPLRARSVLLFSSSKNLAMEAMLAKWFLASVCLATIFSTRRGP